jgi:hypothetical protein
MTKTSQWAGYLASFFAIAFFITALEFRGSGGQPDFYKRGAVTLDR